MASTRVTIILTNLDKFGSRLCAGRSEQLAAQHQGSYRREGLERPTMIFERLLPGSVHAASVGNGIDLRRFIRPVISRTQQPTGTRARLRIMGIEIDAGICSSVRMHVLVREVDAWLGKTLFIPIIIRICQLTGQSQFAISRLLWFLAGLYLLYYTTGFWGRILMGALCFVLMLSASLRADMPKEGTLWLRLFWWFCLVSDGLRIFSGDPTARIASDILILFAEYAITIKTIPPQEKRSRIKKEAEA
jgi:hypothetical protein